MSLSSSHSISYGSFFYIFCHVFIFLPRYFPHIYTVIFSFTIFIFNSFSIMVFLLIHLLMLSVVLMGSGLGSLLDFKPLSPSSNVHVDIVNSMASSLQAHAHQFHSSWRDYCVIYLMVVVNGLLLLTCCGVFVFCFYRGLLLKLRPSPSSSTAVLRT